MYHECIIDWLSITSQLADSPVSPPSILGQYEQGKGMMGYNESNHYDTGIIHLWDEGRTDVHCIYSGKTLANIKDTMTAQSLVQFHAKQGHRVTRIDTAIDVFESGLLITEIAELWRLGKVVTRSKHGLLMSDPRGKNGDTMYIGSRKRKRKLLRVYDKAKEQNVDGDWIRFEMQYAQGAARSAAKAISETVQVDRTIIGQTAGFARIQHKVWEAIQHGVSELKTKHDRPASGGATLSWVWVNVLPALVKLEKQKPGIMALLYNEVIDRVSVQNADKKR